MGDSLLPRDMAYKELITSYLDKQTLIYSKASFRFGKYSLFLIDLVSENSNAISHDLINKLNKLFLSANLLDDIMDKDNEGIHTIRNLKQDFSRYFLDFLLSIKDSLSRKEV